MNLSKRLVFCHFPDDIKIVSKPITNFFGFNFNYLRSEEFISKLKSAGGDTTVGAPQAYDTVRIIASILEKTQNPDEIKKELYNMPLYNGVSGNIQFDEKGDIRKVEYNILEI